MTKSKGSSSFGPGPAFRDLPPTTRCQFPNHVLCSLAGLSPHIWGACSVAATKHTHKIFFSSATICFEELGPHSAPRLSLLHPPEGDRKLLQ